MTRLLNFDPGGEKLGWSVLDSGPRYVDGGVFRWPRNGRPYQEYRMRLTLACRSKVIELIKRYGPDRVVIEIVPAIGSEGFMKSGQGYIANVVATTIHNVAIELHVPVFQVSARSWESRIARRTSKSEKVTKPKIRNGVLEHLPELQDKLGREVGPGVLKEWDRWDALGIGLFALGHETVI